MATATAEKTKVGVGRVLGVLGFLFLSILLNYFLFFVWNVQDKLIAYAPQCSVGLHGTQVIVTIQGWDATSDCNALILSSTQAVQYYAAGTSAEPVVCTQVYAGRQVTIRDTAQAIVNGHVLCQDPGGFFPNNGA